MKSTKMSGSWASAMKSPGKSKALFPTLDQIQKGVKKNPRYGKR